MAQRKNTANKAIPLSAIKPNSTRAKNVLYISYPRVATCAGPGGMILNASRFLEELDDDLYEELRIKRSYGW